MSDLTAEERAIAASALRHVRGRYTADRAAQLSGVPKSTIYDWRRNKVLLPDYANADPAIWSYRDLVLLRLLAWLRQGGMERPLAAAKTKHVREQLNAGIRIRQIHATSRDVVLIGENASDEIDDDRQNLLPSSDFYSLLASFDLHEPIDELRNTDSKRSWAPHLVTPSHHSSISPWVLAGDPCVRNSRIPTAAIFALSTERQLPSQAIVDLYPGLTVEQVDDVTELERRLRGIETAIAA